MEDFIALSVQLTDLAGEVSEIVRIAARVCLSEGAGERFVSLIKTTVPPSFRSRVVAGLQPASLDAAPEPGDVARELKEFARGRSLVVGGGARGVEALQRLLGAYQGPVLDLGELIELFPPGQSRTGRNPAILMSVGNSEAADSLDTEEDRLASTFRGIWAEAEALEPFVLQEIALRTWQTSWPLRFFFAKVAESTAAATAPVEGRDLPSAALTRAQAATSGASSRRRAVAGGVVEALEAATSCASIRSDHGYEPREQQIEMAAAVDAALNGPHHLLVEAGTGTGKSLAYLFPAACLALRNDVRVVISTNTINLQEQLLNKDIPAVRDLLREHAPEDVRGRAADLRSAVLKGRRNYLCLQRLATWQRAAALTETEVRFLVRVRIWLSKGGGDRSGLRLSPEEEAIWNRLSAEGTNCFATGNYFVRNGSCQLAQARKRAEASHLIVVNHALLLSDLGGERHVLPAFDRLILDEAHNLEDEATDRFGFHAGQGDIAPLLDAIIARGRERETGIIADVQTAVGGRRQGAEGAFLAGILQQLNDHVDRARERLPEAFAVIRTFIQQQATGESEYERRLLVSRATRAQPEWSQVEIAWENVGLALSQVEAALERLSVTISEFPDEAVLDKETLLGSIAAQQVAVQVTREGIASILDRHDETRIAWLTLSQGGIAGVSSAPLSVGEMLDTYLFGTKSSVVLTSATLTTSGTFDHIRERLGIQDAEELALGSPFDYARAALILLPSDMPEPPRPQYQESLQEAIVALCAASRGRALILFTSHGALRSTYRATRQPLAQIGIRALGQGIDGTPDELLDALRSRPETVVFGTSSFWEGVDVVGDALSLLVITKLPFSVPSDPVFAARAELFDEPFRDFALPQAVLRFKQGFGRLIRHRGDRGVVAVLDRRLRSKGYGRTFLQSLPHCTVREPRLAGLGEEVEAWLGGADARPVRSRTVKKRPRSR